MTFCPDLPDILARQLLLCAAGYGHVCKCLTSILNAVIAGKPAVAGDAYSDSTDAL